MFRNTTDIPKTKRPINCLVSEGGIGDLICSLMAVNYVILSCPWINLLVFVPDYLKEFAQHVLPPGSTVRNYTEARTKYDGTRLGITTKWIGNFTPMRTHPALYSYNVLCDMTPTNAQLSYLKIRPNEIDITKFSLPENYVTIQGAFTETVKTMPPETLNSISKYVINKGYTPVFLGKTENKTGYPGVIGRAVVDEKIDFSVGINLIDKCSMLETAAIISNSKTVVCMDGGVMHIAGFTETPIVAGFTFVNATQASPIRDGVPMKDVFPVVPDESLGCRGCQSNWTLMYDIDDFRKCFYKDYLCAKQMSFEKFKEQLEKIL